MIMSLRRFLDWLFVLLFALAGDRLAGAAVGVAVSRSQLRFSRLYSGRMTPEVLVLGNSRAVNTVYAPQLSKELSLSVDSLAYNGVTVDIARALALDALDRGASPRWAIIEVTTVQGEPAVLNDLRLYVRDSRRLRSLLRQNYPSTANASEVSWLFSKNSELLLRAAYYARKSDIGWINQYTISPDLVASTKAMPPVSFPDTTQANKILSELVETLEDRGVRVCLVLAPYLDAYLEKIENFKEWKSSVQQAVGGRPLLDLSRALTAQDMFADRIHSNAKGAGEATRRLADAMRNGECGRTD